VQITATQAFTSSDRFGRHVSMHSEAYGYVTLYMYVDNNENTFMYADGDYDLCRVLIK